MTARMEDIVESEIAEMTVPTSPLRRKTRPYRGPEKALSRRGLGFGNGVGPNPFGG